MQASVPTLSTAPQRWGIKEVVTCVIFNIVILIVMTVVSMGGSMLLTPGINYLAGPGLMALLCGPLYMVMAGKISRRGVVLVTSILFILFFLAMGLVNMLLLLPFGIIGELAMAGKDSYRNWKRNAVGYGILFAGFALSAVLPLLFFKQKMVEVYLASYTKEAMDTMFYYYETPGMIALLVVITAAGSVAGCLIGNRFLNRHVKKAKLI